MSAVNSITVVVLLTPWALFLAWEVFVLVRRAKDVKVQTISMVALRKGSNLTSVVYVWAGMAAHWWWPSSGFAPAWASVLFWVAAMGLLVWDVAWWKRPVETWPRWAVWLKDSRIWVVAGLLGGLFLFPQGE